MVAVLGFARAGSPRDSALRRYLTDAIFPYYIVHQTAIIMIAHALRGSELARGRKLARDWRTADLLLTYEIVRCVASCAAVRLKMAAANRPCRCARVSSLRLIGGFHRARKGYMTLHAEEPYLDWNATTPLRPERGRRWRSVDISAIRLRACRGRQARAVEDARHCRRPRSAPPQKSSSPPRHGSEFARAVARLRRGGPCGERLLVSAIEHTSVLAGGRFPADTIQTIG